MKDRWGHPQTLALLRTQQYSYIHLPLGHWTWNEGAQRPQEHSNLLRTRLVTRRKGRCRPESQTLYVTPRPGQSTKLPKFFRCLKEPLTPAGWSIEADMTCLVEDEPFLSECQWIDLEYLRNLFNRPPVTRMTNENSDSSIISNNDVYNDVMTNCSSTATV